MEREDFGDQPPDLNVDPNTLPFRRRNDAHEENGPPDSAANSVVPVLARAAQSGATRIRPAIFTSSQILLLIVCLLSVLSFLAGQYREATEGPYFRARYRLISEDDSKLSLRYRNAARTVRRLQQEADILGEEVVPTASPPSGQIVVRLNENSDPSKIDFAELMKAAKAQLSAAASEDRNLNGAGMSIELPSGLKFTIEAPEPGVVPAASTPKKPNVYDQCLIWVTNEGLVVPMNFANDSANNEAAEAGGFCAILAASLPVIESGDDDPFSEQEGLIYVGDFEPGVSRDYAIFPSPTRDPQLSEDVPLGSPTWMDFYRDKVKRMFFHAFYGYLIYAYPRDELRPLSCSGVDNLGGVQATLIDSLDSLAVLGEWELFESAVRLAKWIDFDIDETVSVFETNIRILGGLLSGHLLATEKFGTRYSGHLLTRAYDVGKRLLRAFEANPTTGMPFGSVNLRHGVSTDETQSTCTACVGTYALEFGWLSLLTGDSTFETAARRAMRSLFGAASPLGLFGGHVNITSSQWVHAEASVGADSDSFYEYLFKAYFAFSDENEYGIMAATALEGIRAHLQKGVWHFDVHAVTAQTVFPWFHALSAFLPGLKVLRGDLIEAQDGIWSAKMVMDRCGGFLPEQFNLQTAQLLEGRTHYPLRPEFVESLWYLYRATKDPALVDWAARFVFNLDQQSRVACGFAGIANVATGELDDRMDSFLLSETLKYLYLVFDADNDFNHLQLVMSTEAHIFPVTDRKGWRNGKWRGLETRKTKWPRPEKASKVPENAAAGGSTSVPGVADEEDLPFSSAIHSPSVAAYRDRSRTAWQAKICDYHEWQEALELRIWGRAIFGSRTRG